MNERPLVLVMEDAKNVLLNTVITIKEQTGLPSSILDGILSGILADLRKDSCSEISLAAARERQELMKKKQRANPRRRDDNGKDNNSGI